MPAVVYPEIADEQGVSVCVPGASKAIPGFDVMDYGQEDYVFGNTKADARHWDTFVLDAFEKYADTLTPLFNAK